MLEGGTGLAIYIALKLGGYAGWSYAGVRWIARAPRPLAAALALGAARLVVGWITGILVAPLAVAAVTSDHVPAFYFTVLPVVRWLEWGIIEMLMPGHSLSGGHWVTGASARSRLWRIGGVAVSYLADAPFLVTSGFPRGRIFC